MDPEAVSRALSIRGVEDALRSILRRRVASPGVLTPGEGYKGWGVPLGSFSPPSVGIASASVLGEWKFSENHLRHLTTSPFSFKTPGRRPEWPE